MTIDDSFGWDPLLFLYLWLLHCIFLLKKSGLFFSLFVKSKLAILRLCM